MGVTVKVLIKQVLKLIFYERQFIFSLTPNIKLCYSDCLNHQLITHYFPSHVQIWLVTTYRIPKLVYSCYSYFYPFYSLLFFNNLPKSVHILPLFKRFKTFCITLIQKSLLKAFVVLFVSCPLNIKAI